jgi:hypothetical protein
MDDHIPMQFETFNYHGATNSIPHNIRREIEQAISGCTVKRPVSTQKVRASILGHLKNKGWPNNVRVDPKNSKINITSMQHEIGLCFQTGNMSRMYADLLKLQAMFANKVIQASVCIVPKKFFTKDLSENVVNFERLTNELNNIFNKVLTVPILVYGIEE